MIIVGSTALKHFGLNRRQPSDVDRWFSESETKDGKEDDYVIPDRILELIPVSNGYATPDAIYTIKCSHFHWDIHWEKTKLDILWLKAKGCQLIPELYYELKGLWEVEHGNKSFLSLKQDKAEFFTDMVVYKYDHDYLHELVAHPDKPMYTNCLKEGHEVWTDWRKFVKMPLEDQIRMIREEVVVIAIERWLTNDHWKGRIDWYKAYMYSLKKTLTRLMKGKFADFIVSNIDKLVLPDYSYFEHTFKTLEEEKLMSNVNMEIFEDIAEKFGVSLERLVVNMSTGDLFEDVKTPFDFPESDGRSYNDPSYEEERKLYWSKVEKHEEQLLESENIVYEHLEQKGGGEGGAEYCYGVFKLNGKIYRAEWSYYSHYGYETDGIENTLREVKPVKKTTTVYE